MRANGWKPPAARAGLAPIVDLGRDVAESQPVGRQEIPVADPYTYKIVELVGSSPEGVDAAVRIALARAMTCATFALHTGRTL